jgi:hypothetical protein
MFRPLDFSQLKPPPATVATTATERAQDTRTVARVATVASPDVAPADAGAVLDAIEERSGLAADRVPSVYLDAWARLNCQKPARVSESEWRLALDNGGLFLDAWGWGASRLAETSGCGN